VSAIDDIIDNIGEVIEKITDATSAATERLQEAEDAVSRAHAVGASTAIDGLGQVKSDVEALVALLDQVGRAGEDAQEFRGGVAR
jgi:hypothetical protein